MRLILSLVSGGGLAGKVYRLVFIFSSASLKFAKANLLEGSAVCERGYFSVKIESIGRPLAVCLTANVREGCK